MRIPGGDLFVLNLNGEDTQLAMWDSENVLTTHQEFAITNSLGMVVGSRVSDGNGPSIDGFGGRATHVAGTLVASGLVPTAKGMSSRATLLAHDYYYGFSEMIKAFVHTNNHFQISNHSYD